MTSPESSARPGRVAGLALLGIAAVALVIGVISLFGSNGDGQADDGGDRPPPSSETSETSGPADPTDTPPETSSTAPAPPTTTTAPPGGTTTTSPTPGPEKSVPVRIYNNSTIKGLAAEAAEDLAAAGWTVAEVGNYSAGRIPTTTVYYTPGTAEEAAARALGEEFGMRVEDRFAGIRDANPGVIVIVTNDYRSAGKDDK
jgi:cytoskeletal protein RodZ